MIKNQYFQFTILCNTGILDSLKSKCWKFSKSYKLFYSFKNIFFTLSAIVILSSCKKEEGLLEVQLPDGTMIFVHPTDNADRIGWEKEGYFYGISELPDITTLTDAFSDFDGEFNTRVIVNQIGKGNYAAKKCDELKAYGYSDWYLPSAGELAALLDQLDIDTNVNYFYWSSTEYDENSAWGVGRSWDFFAIEYVTGAHTLSKNESYTQMCRCVRR